MLKLDTPNSVWKFCNLSLPLALLPFLVLVPLVEGVGLIVVGGSCVALVILMIIVYRIVRNVLLSRGIPRSDLDAMSKAISRASAAAIAVAIPLMLVEVYMLNGLTTMFGVYDTFAYGLNFVTKFGIGLIVLALPLYIGWLAWGKRVYFNQLDKLGVSD